MIKHLSYKDLSQDQRTKGAEKLRDQLRAMLSTPLLSDDQRVAIFAKLAEVSKWERGELEASPSPSNISKDHSVDVTENVAVIES
jgi:hypothetical protein